MEIEKYNWHFYKFRFNNGKWTEKTFKSKEKLFEYIKKYNPNDCYISVAKFLRGKYLLDWYIDLDFDNVPKENLTKTIDYMAENYPSLKPIYCLKSSESSFHIVYPNPFKNHSLEEQIGLRNALGIALEKQGIRFDNYLADWKRVTRLPEAPRYINNKIYFPELLSLEQLRNYKYKITKKEKNKKQRVLYKYKAMKSTIPGLIDRQILVFKQPNIRKILMMQKIYNVGDLYKIAFPGEFYIISLKTFGIERIKKINRFYYGKNKKIPNFRFLRVSPKKTGKIIEDGIQDIELFPQEAMGQYSRVHKLLIDAHSDYKNFNRNYNELIGDVVEVGIVKREGVLNG